MQYLQITQRNPRSLLFASTIMLSLQQYDIQRDVKVKVRACEQLVYSSRQDIWEGYEG